MPNNDMPNNEKFYVTAKEYQKLQAEIEGLDNEIVKIRMELSGAAREKFDRHEQHDSKDIIRRLQMKLTERSEKIVRLNHLVVVQEHENIEAIHSGDFLLIDMFSRPEDVQEYKIKLVSAMESVPEDVMPVTVDSPIGLAINCKAVGDVVTYKVEGISFTVSIKQKLELDMDGSLTVPGSNGR